MCACSQKYMLDKYLEQEIFPLMGNRKMLAITIKTANTDGSEMLKQQDPIYFLPYNYFSTIQ